MTLPQQTRSEKIAAMAEKIYVEAIGGHMAAIDYHVRYTLDFSEVCRSSAISAFEAAKAFYESKPS